jgi:hypothetical protein
MMNINFIREMQDGAGVLASRRHSNKRSQARIVALLLSLCATLSISGCIGLTGAAKPGSSTSTPSAAAISVSPSSVNFGSVAVGGSVSQSVTISNTGGSTLTVTQATSATSGITITGANLPMTVGAGKQSIITIVFSPKSKGAVSGNVTVVSDASSSPNTVAVTGTGVTAAALLNSSASSLSFGNVNAGTSSSQSMTLTNAGNSNVTISSVTVAGAKFSASGISGGLILSPGQNATLNVTFSPSAAGSLTGSVTVASNASNSPLVISLSGAGVVSVAHSVSLAWTADSSPPFSYNAYRSTISGGPYTKLNSSSLSSALYTDSTVQGGHTYFYVVTAVSSAGQESPFSTEVSAIVPAP